LARTVAVTGATGFVGGHLVRSLAETGWSVRALTRRPVAGSGDAPPGVTWIRGTLEQSSALEELLAGSQAVVHCAASIKALDTRAFFKANAEGTERLADIAASMLEPPRFLYMSSVAARHPDISDYAASKRAGEEALAKRSERLTWCALRPGAVYGPGDRETLTMFKMAAARIAALPGSGTGHVSLIHVSDLVGAVVALLDSPVESGAIFEVDDGRPGGYTLRSLYETLGEYLDRRALYLEVPRNVMAAVAFCNATVARLTGRPAMLGPGKVREIYHNDWATDSTPIRHATSWAPRIDAKQGLKATLSWYKSQGLL
jgi:nucleoside-diphosphate-sugar epimerase